jgi:hypothetical protein
MVVAFGGVLLFLFVPDTFWDRTPRARGITDSGRDKPVGRPNFARMFSHLSHRTSAQQDVISAVPETPVTPEAHRVRHAHFADESVQDAATEDMEKPEGKAEGPSSDSDYFNMTKTETAETGEKVEADQDKEGSSRPPNRATSTETDGTTDLEANGESVSGSAPKSITDHYRQAPPRTYSQMLRPYAGRISDDNWFKVAFRPFVLFTYPAVLWSSMVYALSVGWLIVLSESVSTIYKNRETYNFDSVQTGLVYLSPFIGGILGTAVAGKVSDLIVRFMARRNDGVYEPEFRLVMGVPIAITTTIGLMGFGWSAQEKDMWFVPTFFFGVISFGCSLGSTTSITFCVDSYRQYAGEALVTLNVSKSKSLPQVVSSFAFAVFSV